MRVPDPRFRRLASLVAIDADERVALLPCADAGSPWTLPRCPVRARETYVEAAVRLADCCFADRVVRWGAVLGRRWAPPPLGAPLVRVEEHLFLLRTDVSPTSPITARSPGTAARWAPRSRVDDLLREGYRDTTATLIDGYLGGWLPDGPITLD